MRKHKANTHQTHLLQCLTIVRVYLCVFVLQYGEHGNVIKLQLTAVCTDFETKVRTLERPAIACSSSKLAHDDKQYERTSRVAHHTNANGAPSTGAGAVNYFAKLCA